MRKYLQSLIIILLSWNIVVPNVVALQINWIDLNTAVSCLITHLFKYAPQLSMHISPKILGSRFLITVYDM